MNKQEAIAELKKHKVGFGEAASVSVDRAVSVIGQIDEPQKVVVPKFVAEWIKKYKEKGYRLAHALEKVFDDAELSLYIKQQEGDYTEVIAKAWLAYPNITVEQEKLYTVEIPDPYGLYKIRYLFRTSVGNIRIGGNNYRDIFLNVATHLTESEIKKDFEWAWQWAEPVEEEEW